MIGIIQAFADLASNPAGGPSVVMAGISEALVATAVGLLVAIPAVVAYNVFQRQVKRRVSNADSLIRMLVAHYSEKKRRLRNMAGGANLGDDDETISEINVTPFVDVMLVLLIIFMVTANYMSTNAAMELSLPQASSGEAGKQAAPSLLSFTIDKQGRLYFEGNAIELSQIAGIIETKRKNNEKPEVTIAADKSPHGQVIELMDSLRSVGVKDFSIEVELLPLNDAESLVILLSRSSVLGIRKAPVFRQGCGGVLIPVSERVILWKLQKQSMKIGVDN